MQIYLVVNLLTFPLDTLGMCGCAGGVCLQGHSWNQSVGTTRVWRQWSSMRSCVPMCCAVRESWLSQCCFCCWIAPNTTVMGALWMSISAAWTLISTQHLKKGQGCIASCCLSPALVWLLIASVLTCVCSMQQRMDLYTQMMRPGQCPKNGFAFKSPSS